MSELLVLQKTSSCVDVAESLLFDRPTSSRQWRKAEPTNGVWVHLHLLHSSPKWFLAISPSRSPWYCCCLRLPSSSPVPSFYFFCCSLFFMLLWHLHWDSPSKTRYAFSTIFCVKVGRLRLTTGATAHKRAIQTSELENCDLIFHFFLEKQKYRPAC
jgi:hypothetical protein